MNNNIDKNCLMKILKNNKTPVEVRIGNNRYIVEKDFLGIHRENILEIEYTRESTSFLTQSIHFEHSGLFVFQGKLMELDTKYWLEYGPLGDRFKIDVIYDGQTIGNYHNLKSYMGYGEEGTWPIIKNNVEQIIFKLSKSRESEGENTFSISHFKNVFPTLINHKLNVSPDNVLYKQLQPNSQYCINELQPFRHICWESSVIDQISGSNLGTLFYCKYPGFNKFVNEIYGKFNPGEFELFHQKPFITTDKSLNYLETVEFISEDNSKQIEILSRTIPLNFTKEKYLTIRKNTQ